MKAAILAGGRGTRLSELTHEIPKPMLEIGDKPLLRHIMDIYAVQGVNEFVIAAGYKSENIISYFYVQRPKLVYNGRSFVRFDFMDYTVDVLQTGIDTMTGGRVKQLAEFIKEPFFLTYGDGLGNINIWNTLKLHQSKDSIVTLTAVRPEGRFGKIDILDSGKVSNFGEKIESGTDWINGGFMVVDNHISDYIFSDQDNFEKNTIPNLCRFDFVYANKHTGFWKCCDTARDLEELRNIYEASQQHEH